MGLIREPLEVDFEFDPRPLTKEEKERISNYIRTYKTKLSVVSVKTSKANENIKQSKKIIA